MSVTASRPLRSLLFAPADGEKKMAKTVDIAADMVIPDLEDAASFENKSQARALRVLPDPPGSAFASREARAPG